MKLHEETKQVWTSFGRVARRKPCCLLKSMETQFRFAKLHLNTPQDLWNNVLKTKWRCLAIIHKTTCGENRACFAAKGPGHLAVTNLYTNYSGIKNEAITLSCFMTQFQPNYICQWSQEHLYQNGENALLLQFTSAFVCLFLKAYTWMSEVTANWKPWGKATLSVCFWPLKSFSE